MAGIWQVCLNIGHLLCARNWEAHMKFMYNFCFVADSLLKELEGEKVGTLCDGFCCSTYVCLFCVLPN